MAFIHQDFMLTSPTARRLFHSFAAQQPILDFHNHLSPQEIVENRRFFDLNELWLAGDHYKWRAMRANGIDESRITGNAAPYDKFVAWSQTVSRSMKNSLYHWTRLELKRFFEIDEALDERSAPRIWSTIHQRLSDQPLTPWDILGKFNVRAVCTTDDPADDLAPHRDFQGRNAPFRMYPTFRPDAALAIDRPQLFGDWLKRLERVVGAPIRQLDDLGSALRDRHAAFHLLGCRLSDHGLPYCYADPCDDKTAAAIFREAVSERSITAAQADQYRSFMMAFFARLDAEAGWTKQLHLGAMRNNNSRLHAALGSDCGADSIGDWPQAERLGRYLDRIDSEGALPRMIVYNLNPADTYPVATMLGNFQRGPTPAKLQLGSAWWFLDHAEGIRGQLDALSQTGLFAHFVGMVTDSRSLMSFARHEYFRRVLCDMLGGDVESGLIPADDSMLEPIIADICYGNARRFLGLTDEPE